MGTEIKLFSDISELPSGVPWIKVGVTTGKFPQTVARAVVEDNGLPILAITVCSRNEDIYFFRESVLIWHHNAVIGVGHQVTLVQLDNLASTTIDLECYFGYLYPHNDFLLIASARDLYCVEPDGSIRWKAENLGLDGVLVEYIEPAIVRGVGAVDPPDGWEPFVLDLVTGSHLPL